MADRRSPLFDTHVRMGAQMSKGGGEYWFPQAYTSPIEEHVNVRNAVGMQDLTSMGEVDIKGPGAERLPKNYTIFGRVTGGIEALDKVAGVQVRPGPSGENSSPVDPPKIESVTIKEG